MRQGSSTAIATPEEIFEMGVKSITDVSKPELDLYFTSRDRTELLKEKGIVVKTKFFDVLSSNPFLNESVLHWAQRNLLDPAIRLAIKNVSEFVANDVELEITVTSQNILFLSNSEQFLGFKSHKKGNVSLENNYSHWMIKANFNKIAPKATKQIDDFYIQSKTDGEIKLVVKIYASNLPEPISKELLVKVEAQA